MTAVVARVLAIAAVLIALASPPLREGYLSRYDQRPTDATVAAQIDYGHITRAQVEAADVLIAVMHCWRVGETGQMTITNSNMVTFRVSYLVIDCANPEHTAAAWMYAEGIVAELDYYAAQEYLGDSGGWGEIE